AAGVPAPEADLVGPVVERVVLGGLVVQRRAEARPGAIADRPFLERVVLGEDLADDDRVARAVGDALEGDRLEDAVAPERTAALEISVGRVIMAVGQAAEDRGVPQVVRALDAGVVGPREGHSEVTPDLQLLDIGLPVTRAEVDGDSLADERPIAGTDDPLIQPQYRVCVAVVV